MGTYMTTVVETLGPEGWSVNETPVFTNDPRWTDEASVYTHQAFHWQEYVMFSFFADVRTLHRGVVPLAPGRGLPDDISDTALEILLGGWGAHGWLYGGISDSAFETVSQKVDNRNFDANYGFSWISFAELKSVNYEATITSIENPSKSELLRNALGERYFVHLDQLSQLGAPEQVRILFCFSG